MSASEVHIGFGFEDSQFADCSFVPSKLSLNTMLLLWINKSSHPGGSHADTGTPRKMKPWMVGYHQEQKLMQRL